MNDLSKYLDLYLQTSRDELQVLNASLVVLEKNPTDSEAIENIFRSAHTLKSQSAAMMYQSTGFLCHTIEDAFFEIKEKKLQLTPQIADALFTAFDGLTSSINHIEKEKTELDLSAQAETLKKITGVKTEGAGKSTRTGSSSPETTVQKAVQEQQPVVEKSQSTEEEPVAEVKIKSISVKVEVLDQLMDQLEELLVQRLKLKKIIAEGENAELNEYFESSQKVLDTLQYQIMQARAVPLHVIFDHLPRAVRDLARTEKKEIELTIEGADLELDRSIVDELDEPIIHILRNAVSHGIETTGTITISAKREKEFAVISIADTGMGIDWDKLAQKAGGGVNKKNQEELLFSGTSTADTVTQISGRGVGLKTVKKMIDTLGGTITVLSEKGKGTTFIIKLPLTLAIAKALLVTVDKKDYAIPTAAIERIVQVPSASIKKVADQEVFVLEKTDIPLLRLQTLLQKTTHTGTGSPQVTAVIMEVDNEKVGLVVDTVSEATDIIMKPIPDILRHIKQYSGTTILSNGNAALILNPTGLL